MNYIKTIPAIIIAALLVAGCSSKPKTDAANTETQAEVKGQPVKVFELKKTTIAKSIDFTASVLPFEEVSLSPSTPGRIDKIYVEVGDRVQKGSQLFLMDRTQLLQAKIQLANLEKDLTRLDTLLLTGSTKQQQYDQLKAQYDVTKSNVDFLEENTLLEAPFNGIITGRYYESGEMYSGAPTAASGGKSGIVTLMQINPVKVIVQVSEQYYPLIKRGMPVQVTSDVFSNESFKGKIYMVHPTINAMTRSFEVEIEVPNNGEKLRPGMFVRAAMDLEQVEAFVVPASTVLIQEGTNIRYVFVENGGTVTRVDVTMGKRFNEMLEIISENLKGGEMLVSQGQVKLVNGDKVEVIK